MTTNIPLLMQRLKVAAKNGCCHTIFPDDCLALVGALEKAKLRIEELEHKHCGGSLMERELAHSEVIYKLMSEIDNLESRIAELESRTVKLPKRHSMLLREDFNEDYHTEMAYKADEVQASLAAAGIKVEAE
ncbi:TPA: hypothetical protein NBS83_000300 [Klebsiella pneumoniae]|nr:hypothetical protein [Klebsiella pneumoniae]